MKNKTARFTDKMLATLINQQRPFAGRGTEIQGIQDRGMTVECILPNGRVNVVYTINGENVYRTFSPRALVIA